MSSFDVPVAEICGEPSIGGEPSFGIVPVPLRELKRVFHCFSIKRKRNKSLLKFGCHLYPNPDTGLYGLSVKALLYPKIIFANLVDGGDLVCAFTFKDEENLPVYIKFTFFKIGKFYYAPTVTFNFFDRLLGNYNVINIETYQSFFKSKFPLTRKQALKLFIRSLGEIVLIPFLDFFVDTNQEKPYDKTSMIKRAMERFLGKDPLPYHEEGDVYTLK